MPEVVMPETYSSPDDYIKNVVPQVVRQNNDRAEFSNPIREFEQTGVEAANTGIYYLWGTLSKAQRIAHLETLRTVSTHEHASPDEKAAVTQRRWRYLNFIIQEESRLMKDGYYEVAVMAFNFLIPKQR